MKKIISLVLACIMLTVLGLSALALGDNIKYADKTPIETPNFKPTIDGKKDAGYTTTYVADKSENDGKIPHEGGSKISTAWYENTLYFFIEVPDVTPQENGGAGLWNWQRDGVWFMLFFGGDRDDATKADSMKQTKYWKFFPTIDEITFSNSVNGDPIEPAVAEDFEWKIETGENGYTIEVAYTVPEATSKLAAAQEIAFEVQIFDMNDPRATYRYFLANGSEGNSENFCTAWGAKLVLGEVKAVAPDTADFTGFAVLMGVVALAGTALVIRKKH